MKNFVVVVVRNSFEMAVKQSTTENEKKLPISRILDVINEHQTLGSQDYVRLAKQILGYLGAKNSRNLSTVQTIKRFVLKCFRAHWSTETGAAKARWKTIYKTNRNRRWILEQYFTARWYNENMFASTSKCT